MYQSIINVVAKLVGFKNKYVANLYYLFGSTQIFGSTQYLFWRTINLKYIFALSNQFKMY